RRPISRSGRRPAQASRPRRRSASLPRRTSAGAPAIKGSWTRCWRQRGHGSAVARDAALVGGRGAAGARRAGRWGGGGPRGRAGGGGGGGRAMTSVGTRAARKEDPRLLRGLGRFGDDFSASGQCWGRVVRSPVAHGRLRSVGVRGGAG